MKAEDGRADVCLTSYTDLMFRVLRSYLGIIIFNFRGGVSGGRLFSCYFPMAV